MRVLAIYPGLDKRYNDIAYALIQLRQMGIELTVITSRHSALKTANPSPEYEDMAGIPIHRVYRNYAEQTAWPLRKYDWVKEIATSFKPDLILCSQQLNMPIGKQLKADLDVPLVLVVEFARNPFLLLGKRRYYLGVGSLAPLIAKLYWLWLSNSSDAIITCNPADRHHLQELSVKGTPVYSVRWCNQPPEGIQGLSLARKPGKGIYAGSLQKRSFKNSEELLLTIPLILEHTPTTELVIIGNGALAGEIEKLAYKWQGKLHHIKELTRKEIWELTTSSFYAYTPVIFGGWGFIGDAWSAKTPLVVTHNGYEFVDGQDVVIGTPDQIHLEINKLYNDTNLYSAIQQGGENRYKEYHSAEKVAKGYYQVFCDSLS